MIFFNILFLLKLGEVIGKSYRDFGITIEVWSLLSSSCGQWPAVAASVKIRLKEVCNSRKMTELWA